MLTAIAGLLWAGGAAEVLEKLTGEADIVVRYQGGGAGHTFSTGAGSYRFRLLPEGLKSPGKVCVLGDGMVVDLDALRQEIAMARYFQLPVGPHNLKISARAAVLMPFHIREGALARQLDGEPGESFRQGFPYAYAGKCMRQALRMGDLLRLDLPAVRQRLRRCVDYENRLLVRVYGDAPLDYRETVRWCEEQAAVLAPYICDTGAFLSDAAEEGKEILLTAQFGALLDLDCGLYPYTVSFNTLAGFAAARAGLPGLKPGRVVGTLHAYAACPPDGPFPAGDAAGADWGEKLLRPEGWMPGVRYGAFDLPAARYGLRLQRPDSLILCGLDALSALPEIPVVTGYRVGDRLIRELDALSVGDTLDGARPETETLPGWGSALTARRFSELPKEAKAYAGFLEQQLGRRFDGVAAGGEILPR